MICISEMSSLETYPGFNPSIKLTGIDEEKILKPNREKVGGTDTLIFIHVNLRNVYVLYVFLENSYFWAAFF